MLFARPPPELCPGRTWFGESDRLTARELSYRFDALISVAVSIGSAAARSTGFMIAALIANVLDAALRSDHIRARSHDKLFNIQLTSLDGLRVAASLTTAVLLGLGLVLGGALTASALPIIAAVGAGLAVVKSARETANKVSRFKNAQQTLRKLNAMKLNREGLSEADRARLQSIEDRLRVALQYKRNRLGIKSVAYAVQTVGGSVALAGILTANPVLLIGGLGVTAAGACGRVLTTIHDRNVRHERRVAAVNLRRLESIEKRVAQGDVLRLDIAEEPLASGADGSRKQQLDELRRRLQGVIVATNSIGRRGRRLWQRERPAQSFERIAAQGADVAELKTTARQLWKTNLALCGLRWNCESQSWEADPERNTEGCAKEIAAIADLEGSASAPLRREVRRLVACFSDLPNIAQFDEDAEADDRFDVDRFVRKLTKQLPTGRHNRGSIPEPA